MMSYLILIVSPKLLLVNEMYISNIFTLLHSHPNNLTNPASPPVLPPKSVYLRMVKFPTWFCITKNWEAKWSPTLNLPLLRHLIKVSSGNYYSVFNCIFVFSVNHIKYFIPRVSNKAQYIFTDIMNKYAHGILFVLTQNKYLKSRVLVYIVYPCISPYSVHVKTPFP